LDGVADFFGGQNHARSMERNAGRKKAKGAKDIGRDELHESLTSFAF
jgi:hypothetical protein